MCLAKNEYSQMMLEHSVIKADVVDMADVRTGLSGSRIEACCSAYARKKAGSFGLTGLRSSTI
jgi:hypothetical protein